VVAAVSSSRIDRYRDRIEHSLSLNFESAPGRQIGLADVRGYAIDFSVSAPDPSVLPRYVHEPGRHLWGRHILRGLGCYERWLRGEGEEWLAGARAAADLLREAQAPTGGWVHRMSYPHTFDVRPPWVSALSQGLGASLLVRIYAETGDDRYAEAALRALRPLSVPSSEGGVCALLDGRPFPEEYPTDPPSFVLNGGIYGLWGICDVGVGLRDAEVTRAFEESVDTLAANIDRWDTGRWSLYDLYRHRVRNVASPAYHKLHIMQLEAMELIAPRPEIRAAADRFAVYLASIPKVARAFAEKVLFRVGSPRSRRYAAALPWARQRSS
jgi:heparosan-N-sulfate-glucuronate 5-epimerase